jgi:hypothetical protein
MQLSTDLGDTKCARDDLRAYLVRSDDYTVDVDGTAQDYVGSTDFDADDIDEYHCAKCLQYWPVTDRWNTVARAEAWRQAVAHLAGPDKQN